MEGFGFFVQRFDGVAGVAAAPRGTEIGDIRQGTARLVGSDFRFDGVVPVDEVVGDAARNGADTGVARLLEVGLHGAFDVQRATAYGGPKPA